MAKISGKVGSVGAAEARRFVVSDDSEDFDPPGLEAAKEAAHSLDEMSEDEQQDILEYRKRIIQERKAVAERPTQQQKRRVDLLLGIGRLETVVEIDGSEFVLQTLKNSELRSVCVEAAKVKAVEFDFEFRTQILARALLKLDGVPIDYALQGVDLNISERLNDQRNDQPEKLVDTLFIKRLVFLDELGDHVLQQLMAGYTRMTNEFKQKFAVKSEEDAKEVLSSLKK